MRTPHQDVLVRLLKEIDATCAELNISYAAVDRLAWQAYKFHEFRDSTFDAYLAVAAEDADKLERALLAREGRTTERYRIGNTRVLRYIDENSFYHDLRDTRRLTKPGLALDIRLLDFKQGNEAAYVFDSKNLSFARDVFFPVERHDFEGIQLPIPGGYDRFFSAIVCKEWRKKNYSGTIRKDDLEALCDPTLPYEQALHLPEIKRVVSSTRFHHRPLFNHLIRKRKPADKKVTKYENARNVSPKRFYHWEQLYPQESRISELSQAGDTETLREILAPLIKDIRTYVDKAGVGIFVDQLVYEACKPLIIESYGEKFFERYDKAIPAGHRRDIAEYLKDEGIDHPLL